MQIIILGAGQVGSSLARNLVAEGHDVTVVDDNPDPLHSLQNKLDIRTIIGHASYPEVLTQAGGMDADMLIAVTNRDEINMLACQVAFSLFQTRIKSHAFDHRTFSVTIVCSASKPSPSMSASTLSA